MSEVDLPSLAQTAHELESKAQTPLQEVSEALKACTFGRFNIKLLCGVFMFMVGGVLVTNSTPYLLPMAECDLDMSLLDKGVLNAAPYIGMTLSSVVAGFLTDTFGRKKFVIYGNFGIFMFTVIAATSQTYKLLIFAKFFEGLLFGASFSAVLTMTAEFCYNEIRDRVMLCQASFVAAAQVLIALMSWGILTQDWKFTLFDGYLVFNTWNIYLLIMSVWSLTTSITYCFLPESPKYLVSREKYDEARTILINVYMENTGKSEDSFPFVNIWKNQAKQIINEMPEHSMDMTLAHKLVAGLHSVKPMFQRPLLYFLIVICSSNFLIMFVYNSIRLWFPQLSTIVEHYQSTGDNDLCVMLDSYTSDLRTRVSNDSEVCIPTKSGTETYINSIIFGFVCWGPYLISGILVNKLGKKFLQVAAGCICISCLFGIRFSTSKVVVVALFSLITASAQMMMSLTQAITVQFFPTASRTLAISTSMTFGRIGSLVGNVILPILLNIGCVVPFYTLGGVMIVATVITLIMPAKKT